MEQDFPLLRLSDLLGVSDLLITSLRQGDSLLNTSRSSAEIRSLHNRIERVFLALATFEVAAKSTFFELDTQLMPVDPAMLKQFVRLNLDRFFHGKYGLATEFVARYSGSYPQWHGVIERSEPENAFAECLEPISKLPPAIDPI